MRTGIFGGTFDPVHLGHKHCLLTVIEKVGLDRVIIMPDRIPPHKQSRDIASPEDRVEMLRLTFSDVPYAEISDMELKREGKSYSVITLRQLHQEYPEEDLCFIMGSDMLLCFDKWYCWQEILTLCTLICVSRSDEDTDKLEPFAQKLRNEGGKVIIVPVEPFEVSSTEIRKTIAGSGDCTCYLDKNVIEYIKKKNLYTRDANDR